MYQLLGLLVVAALVIAGVVFLTMRTASESFVVDGPPTVIRVVDPGAGIDDADLIPINSANPVARHGATELLRFGSDGAEYLAAVTPESEGWLRPIPAGSGECGVSGDVIVCETPDNTGIAISITDGSHAGAGDYEVDSTPDPHLAENVAGAVAIPDTVAVDAESLAVVNAGEGHLVADRDALRFVVGDEVRWEVPLPAGAAELNGLGTDQPRWVVDDRVLLLAFPDAIVALDISSGDELWRIAATVQGWFVDDSELYVHHDGIVDVYDLTTPQSSDATPAPTAQLPVPPVHPVLAELDAVEFLFSSGAGGWATVVEFAGDGTFLGQYRDSDAFDTIRSDFHGRFEVVEQIDEHTHRLGLVELVVDSPTGTTGMLDNGVPVEYVDSPYGFETGTEFLLHGAGTPVSSLSEDTLGWLQSFGIGRSDSSISERVLVNVDPGYAMIEYEFPEGGGLDPGPTPTATAETAPTSEAAASFDGTWCTTPESSATYAGCFTIAGDEIRMDSGETFALSTLPSDAYPGCTNLTAVAQGPGGSGPVGLHCPAGTPIELQGYSGADHSDVDRIWNVQTGTLHLRQ